MTSYTLTLAALVAFIVATVYTLVGITLWRRPVPEAADRRALRYFALWWLATAANIYLAGAFYLAAAIGAFDFRLQFGYILLQRVLLAASLWALLTYLGYLVTGRDWSLPAGVVYFLHAILMMYMIYLGRPTGIYVGRWRTDLEYSATAPLSLELVNLVLVVVAPILASLAYLRLARRIPKGEPEQRFRAVLVSCALVVWWLVAVAAGQRNLLQNDLFQMVNRFLGLAMALLILVAYRPPAWVRRRWEAKAPAAAPA